MRQTTATTESAKRVLQFWFEELKPEQWWKKDNKLDHQIEQNFSLVLSQAKQNELYTWRASLEGRLAEVIILDQFSRNIFRNQPEAFQQDAQALALALEAIHSHQALEILSEAKRDFMMMPLMHSESLVIHQFAEECFRKYGSKNSYNYELKHKVIIERFSRYPHRNRILGRPSTQEEEAFLKQPDSSF